MCNSERHTFCVLVWPSLYTDLYVLIQIRSTLQNATSFPHYKGVSLLSFHFHDVQILNLGKKSPLREIRILPCLITPLPESLVWGLSILQGWRAGWFYGTLQAKSLLGRLYYRAYKRLPSYK